MKRTVRAVLLLTLALLLLTAGCYTVLRHPTGGEVIQEGAYYRSCADCHADASFYHPYGNPYYRYGRSHYVWGSYYGSPWWYNDYWWWDDHYDYDHHYDDDYEGPEIETGTRHLWGDSGWPSSGWGFNPPTPSSVTPPQSSPEPPKMKDAQRKPEKEKKPPRFRPDQEKVKEKDNNSGSEKPEKKDGEKKDKAPPRLSPKRGS